MYLDLNAIAAKQTLTSLFDPPKHGMYLDPTEAGEFAHHSTIPEMWNVSSL